MALLTAALLRGLGLIHERLMEKFAGWEGSSGPGEPGRRKVRTSSGAKPIVIELGAGWEPDLDCCPPLLRTFEHFRPSYPI